MLPLNCSGQSCSRERVTPGSFRSPCLPKTTPFSPLRTTIRSASGICEHRLRRYVRASSPISGLPAHLPSCPQGLLNIAGHPCVAYDPTGTVFAVALNLRSTIMMYAMEAFDKQPFLCVHLDDPVLGRRLFPPRVPVMTSLSFSNDGKWLLVGTSGDVHYVLDSFDGSLLARLESACLFLFLRTVPARLGFRLF